MAISLKESQELISQLCKKNPSIVKLLTQSTANGLQSLQVLEPADLINWFESLPRNSVDVDTDFLIARLNVSLLKDLATSKTQAAPEEKKVPKWTAKATLVLLAIAGTIYSACDGFDGITALLGIFPVSTYVLLAVGVLFSILSIIFFYSFDLVEISKNLGVEFSYTPRMLDVLLDEYKQIKIIRLILADPVGKDVAEIKENIFLAKMLLKRHQALNVERNKFLAAFNNPYLKKAQKFTAGVAGIIFFSAGFFSGQTVAMFFANLFLASVATTLWPIVVASVGVGLAAFGVYWLAMRPGMENLISRWMHLDKDKVDALCDTKEVEGETGNLKQLIAVLKENKKIKKQHVKDEIEKKALKEENSNLHKEVDTLQGRLQAARQYLEAHNGFGLFDKRSRSSGDLPSLESVPLYSEAIANM